MNLHDVYDCMILYDLVSKNMELAKNNSVLSISMLCSFVFQVEGG